MGSFRQKEGASQREDSAGDGVTAFSRFSSSLRPRAQELWTREQRENSAGDGVTAFSKFLSSLVNPRPFPAPSPQSPVPGHSPGMGSFPQKSRRVSAPPYTDPRPPIPGFPAPSRREAGTLQ